MTNKTDKELAVEVALAYISSASNLKNANGSSTPLPKIDHIQAAIKSTYKTLKELD